MCVKCVTVCLSLLWTDKILCRFFGAPATPCAALGFSLITLITPTYLANSHPGAGGTSHGRTLEEKAAVGLALPHLILTMALLQRDADTVAGSPAPDAQTTSPLHRKRCGGLCRASHAPALF